MNNSVGSRSVGSFGLEGVDSYLVQVEVDSRRGLPGFDIVGLPDTTVKESRDRIQSALKNLGYPTLNSKIVANLAPADKRKIGSVYDLPLLLALLVATDYEDYSLEGLGAVGEVGLFGEIRGIPGVLPMVLDAKKLGLKRVIVPLANGEEAAVAEGIQVYAAAHVKEVIDFLNGRGELVQPTASPMQTKEQDFLDFKDVKGQLQAKRAMEVGAAGGHNLILIGPPGAGKSMLARRLPSILPPLTRQEAVETTKVYSVAGLLESHQSLMWARPFRAPHHSVSSGALVGGGSHPQPGDLSLAHNGVLFLDEIPEFPKKVLEVLRQPLEDGKAVISRVRYRAEYPAHAMLVAAMNPCPCGYFGSTQKTCRCTSAQIQRYLGKISGPLLDRIDIQVEVQPVEYRQMRSDDSTGSSKEMGQRVYKAREIQQKRYKDYPFYSNAQLPSALLQKFCVLESAGEALLKSAFDRLGLSARGYSRILKVARTISDLDQGGPITVAHISEAIQFRSLDRKYWRE